MTPEATRLKPIRSTNGSGLPFEAQPWKAADNLRNNTDSAEYKHLALGLIFLKYIPDASDERHAYLSSPEQTAEGTEARCLDMASMPTAGRAPREAVMPAVGSGAKLMNGDTLLASIAPCLESTKTAYADFLDDEEVDWGADRVRRYEAQGAAPQPLCLLPRPNRRVQGFHDSKHGGLEREAKSAGKRTRSLPCCDTKSRGRTDLRRLRQGRVRAHTCWCQRDL